MANYYVPKFLEEAFSEGFTHIDGNNEQHYFFTFDMGKLKISNGKIIACDPLIYDNELPFETLFPIGEFPVQLAISRVGTDERVAFARIKFSIWEPVLWKPATCKGQHVATLTGDEYFGYGIDTARGCFMDTSGAEELKKFMDEDKDNFVILMDEQNKNARPSWDNLLWERNQRNVALFKSGWGDGFYGSFIGIDADGAICRLVTDFKML